ncbi:MAG TPA: hypothetical protein DD381_00185 [Lentisphaeria bacterium]|nr:MAG: hypothetical protein A2X47_05540 [Lentisphaerae bacterium GWF2_38_69]HBM14759.1 hypothetical protein [Lentisphaeria bacterium]
MKSNKLKTENTLSVINRLALKAIKPYAPLRKYLDQRKSILEKIKMKDFKSKEYDPNGQLTEREIKMAQYAGALAFRECRIEPLRVTDFNCPTLVIGTIGDKKTMVFVRVTHEISEIEGTGKIPLALIDAALEYKAEPHLVRINIADKGDYYVFDYWGIEDLIRIIKSYKEDWNKILLKGKTIKHFLDLKHGNIDTFELKETSIIINTENNSFDAVDIIDLLLSTKASDEYYIFTCTCGVPECADINHGVVVVHEDKYVLWKLYRKRKSRIYIFDRDQYINAIINMVKAFIKENKDKPKWGLGTYLRDLKSLEKALYEIDNGEISTDFMRWGATKKSQI